ncbi:MAG: hypothetical protein NC182_05580 [Prevotella sp.]|nr:hypothetical protein [Staphylococcus sp.]MCM1350656.1 hypothetical protein [Prevotella sp.]
MNHKRIIGYMSTGMGVMVFLSLYVMVCLIQEEQVPSLRHWIVLLGYISIGLFGFGFFTIVLDKRKQKEGISYERPRN